MGEKEKRREGSVEEARKYVYIYTHRERREREKVVGKDSARLGREEREIEKCWRDTMREIKSLKG